MKSPVQIGKCLIILLVGCFIWANGICQVSMADLKNSTPAQRAGYQTNMMKTKLNLDAGQVNKVAAINLNYAQKFEPIVKGNDSRLTKFRQAKALQAAKDKELQAVFTTTQFKQYQDFEAEMKNKVMAKMKGE